MPIPESEKKSPLTSPIRLIPETQIAGIAGRTESESPRSVPIPNIKGYEILGVIGAGGMGVVYKARHRDLNRIAAIKTLRGIALNNSEFRERFQAEAEAVAKLHHPNIIQLYEIGLVEPLPGEKTPSPFLAFEYVEGGALSNCTHTPLPPRYVAELVEKAARGVHAAHLMGVIHRDLKPANILLDAAGNPKIADFGVAKHLDSERDERGRFVTQSGIVMGTPEYMASEQVAGETPTPAFDIYAIGVILYELLTARVPFQGESPADTMYFARYQEPVPPRRLQPSVPRDLETICMKCLEKNPARRYSTAEDLADDLARWLDGRTIRARPAGMLERTVRAANRNPAIAVLCGLIVFVSSIGIGGIFWQWQEALENAAEALKARHAAELAGAEAHQAAQSAARAAASERWERYRSDIGAALSSLELHSVGAARQSLDSAPNEHRNWEWEYIATKLDQADLVVDYRDLPASMLSIAKSGSRVLITPKQIPSEAIIWDAMTRREVRRFPVTVSGHPCFISSLGGMIVVATPEHALRFVDADTGKHKFTITGPIQIAPGPVFSGDDSRVSVTESDGSQTVWDTAAGKPIQSQSPAKGWNTTEINVDGSLIATSTHTSTEVVIRQTITGESLKLTWNGRGIQGMKFSPGGDRLLTAEVFPSCSLRLWDLKTRKQIACMTGHTNAIQEMSFSPDGSRIASCSLDQTVRVWDAFTGELKTTLQGHRGWVMQARFSPNGNQIVSASDDRTIRLWDAASGQLLAVLLGHTGSVNDVRYTLDGKTLISTAFDGTIRLWDAETTERNGVLGGHTSFVYGVAFMPDNKHIASCGWDSTVRLWNATSGSRLWERKLESAVVYSVAVQPQGRFVATASRDNKVRLLDAATGHEVHSWLAEIRWPDGRIAFNPTGDLLAAATNGGGVRLFNIQTREQVAVLRTRSGAALDVAFSPDGKYLASCHYDGESTLNVWELRTGELVHRFPDQPHRSYTVSFSPDGSLLAVGSLDGMVRIRETAGWKELAILKHGSNVYSLAFSPNNSRLATGCADNTIRVWDTRTFSEVAELRGHTAYIHSVQFSPDGTRLVSGSGDMTIRLWDTLSPAQRSALDRR